jgi:MFS family permease
LSPFDAAHRRLTVGVLLCMSVIGFQALGVATALPVVARDLDGLGSYGWGFTATLLASLPGIVGGGLLADRDRAGGALLAALAAFGAGCLLAALAPSWPVFLAARVLQGLGLGVLGSLIYVAVGRAYPPQLHGRVLALTSTAWILPALLGPAAAGAVAEHVGWPWVFVGLVPALPVVAVLAVPGMRGLPRSDEAPPTLRALARPGVGTGIAARGLLAVGFLGSETLIPLGLVEVRGLSAAAAGLVVSAGSLSWAAGALTQGRLDRADGGAGRLRRLRAGALVLAVGAGLTAAGMAAGTALVAAGWVIAGLGVGMAYPSVGALVLGAAGPATGAASAGLQVVETLAVAAVATAGGLAVGALDLATPAFVAALGLAATAPLATALLTRRSAWAPAPAAGR